VPTVRHYCCHWQVRPKLNHVSSVQFSYVALYAPLRTTFAGGQCRANRRVEWSTFTTSSGLTWRCPTSYRCWRSYNSCAVTSMTGRDALSSSTAGLNVALSYTPFTRSSKRRAIIEQTSSKCIQNTLAQRVLLSLDVCLTFAWCLLGVGYALCMLDICSMFARWLLDRVNGVLVISFQPHRFYSSAKRRSGDRVVRSGIRLWYDMIRYGFC